MWLLSGLWRRLGADERGVSAIEAAIALPVLGLALCGTLEFGLNVYNRQQLQAAVQAGAQYALKNPNDTAGIKSTILGALPTTAGATVGPDTTGSPPDPNGIMYACECNNGTSITCSATMTCPSGTPRRIVILKVERDPVQLVSMLVAYRPSKLRAQGAINVSPQ